MGVLFLGELSLEGTVQPVRGVFPQLLGAGHGRKRAVVAARERRRGRARRGRRRADRGSLHELVSALRGQSELPVAHRAPEPRAESRSTT